MESAWASSTKIERSKTRLERLGYFQEVNVETPAVPGTSDQIDVNYNIVEKSSGNIMAGVGYSQQQGIIFNANVTQDNVFGTGKRVGFNFNNSRINTIYQASYLNPYTTLDGVSSGFDLSYRKMDAYVINLANYATDTGQVGTNLGIPLSEFDSIRFNLDYNYTNLRVSNQSSREILEYIRNYTTTPPDSSYGFNYIPIAVGYVHDTLNRAIFPTDGGAERVSFLATPPVFGKDSVNFFKGSAKTQHYFPVAKDLTLMVMAEVAYGGSYSGTPGLPFWENYFAGGPQVMRGFYPSSLGPRTLPNELGVGGGLSLGGSSKIVSSIELLAPIPFLEDSKNMRIGAFVDIGNVYCEAFQVASPKGIAEGGGTPCFAEAKGDFLRYSPGLLARWISPFGALGVSVAKPLNSVQGDRLQMFQFSFGQAF
jgi:outer membrane protein insertion porin family